MHGQPDTLLNQRVLTSNYMPLPAAGNKAILFGEHAVVYGAPAIVVDFGTATNIDVIDEEGYYIGGAIAPGIRISMDALAARAAKLASVPLEAPEHAIGRD